MKHEIIDQGDTKKYFTQIPNIVLDLGLTPYEQVLYDHLKRSAEAKGQCSKSTRTLAQECRMSPTVVVKAKASLAKPRHELNKKPLIKITKRENPKGGKEYDEISIVDIWRENTNRYAPPEQENQVLDMELAPDGQVPRNGLASTTVSVKQVPVVEHRKNIREEDIKEDSSARFFNSLKTNPAYAHVDLERETGKMQAWLSLPRNKGRKMTPRFVLNWLNKIEVPLPLNGNGHKPPNRFVPNDAPEVCLRCYNTGMEQTEKGSRPCQHNPL